MSGRLVLATWVLLALAAPAWGNPALRREAARRVALGNQSYEQGRYQDALRLYLAAYDLFPSPDLLFNVGLAHEKVLEFEQCALAFARYLEESPNAVDRDKAAARRDQCRERSAVPVRISSMPPGALVVLHAAATTARVRTPGASSSRLAPTV